MGWRIRAQQGLKLSLSPRLLSRGGLETYGRSHRRPTVGFFSDLPWVVKGGLKEVTFPPVKRLKIPRPKLLGPIRIRFVPETYTS